MRIDFFDSSAAEFEIVKAIRTCVFTNEQGADADNEFDEYDWLNHYQDTFFETDAKVTIKSGFLLTGT